MQPIDNAAILSPWEPGIFALVVFTVAVLAVMGVILFLTAWAGEKKPNFEKQRPYESGIIPTGSARLRFPVPFFLVAIFFLIFDVEGAFILSCKSLGWTGWFQMSFFIFVLILGLVYIWKRGGLNWGPASKTE